MDLEHNEQFRTEATERTMKAMADIACDAKEKAEDRIAAGKLVDAMSDSIIKAHMIFRMSDTSDKTNKKLMQSLDKLVDKQED